MSCLHGHQSPCLHLLAHHYHHWRRPGTMCDRLSVHGRGMGCALPRLLGWDDGNTYGNRYASMQLLRLV